MTEERPMGKETFVVQILHTQNASWQGTITWMREGKQEPFRSALELIRLMDSALGASTAPASRETPGIDLPR